MIDKDSNSADSTPVTRALDALNTPYRFFRPGFFLILGKGNERALELLGGFNRYNIVKLNEEG